MNEPDTRDDADPSRREFLCALAGCAAALAGSCSEITHTPFFQKRFRDLGEDERASIVAELSREQSERFGKPITVGADEAREGGSVRLCARHLALRRLPTLRVRVRR